MYQLGSVSGQANQIISKTLKYWFDFLKPKHPVVLFVWLFENVWRGFALFGAFVEHKLLMSVGLVQPGIGIL